MSWLPAALGALCGVATLFAMRRFTDQRALRFAKSRVRAHLYELRLFGDDPLLAWRAHKKLLLWNLRYLRHTLAPAAVVAIPAVLVAAQLDALYGRRALAPGEAATLTAQLKPGATPEPVLELPPSFEVETPPVRIPEIRQICWRVRAVAPADGELRMTLGRETARRPVHAGPGLRYITETCSSSLLESLLSTCRLESNAADWIAVDYPPRKIPLAGIEAHWLVWFALCWLAAMLSFRRRLRVTF